jgi:hypothetical protein
VVLVVVPLAILVLRHLLGQEIPQALAHHKETMVELQLLLLVVLAVVVLVLLVLTVLATQVELVEPELHHQLPALQLEGPAVVVVVVIQLVVQLQMEVVLVQILLRLQAERLILAVEAVAV